MDTIHGKLTLKNNAANSVSFSFVLTNTCSKTLHICKYYSPLEGICNSGVITALDVASQQNLEYKGIMAKRRPPNSSDYVTLKPGESFTNDFSANCFAWKAKHTYEVSVNQQWNQTLNLQQAHNASEILMVDTPTITITLQ